MALTATLQEHNEFQRETEWRQAGVPEPDIVASRQNGMDARDIKVFREYSANGYIFVIRAPKLSARAMHGLFPPKIMAVKDKTGTSGVVVSPRGMFVSDYDMMSVWKRAGEGWRKVFISAADGASQGPWPPEATSLVRDLNALLVSRLQHGCQDDFHSPKNPGVKQDHFAVFVDGTTLFFPNPFLVSRFYAEHALEWPYDANGKYSGAGAA